MPTRPIVLSLGLDLISMANGLQKAIFPKDSLPISIPFTIGSITISSTTPTNLVSTITAINHGLNTGDAFYLAMTTIENVSVVGLSPDTKYFVSGATKNSFEISTSYAESVKVGGSRVGVSDISQIITLTLLCSIYYVRYRIISKDKNRYSHWSPIYHVVDANPIILLPGTAIDGGKV